MEKGTGLKINAFFASDYAGVIEGMRFKKVQIAWFGNKSAMEAVDRADGEVFAQTVAANGNAGYWSHIIVHKDSPFQKLEDVLKCDKSLDFGIGDPNSTSGFLVPTTFVFSATQHRPEGRASRRCAPPTTRPTRWPSPTSWCTPPPTTTRTWSAWRRPPPTARSSIRVIWTSPLIPSDPLVWRKDLDAGTKKKIADWLFAYGNGNATRRRRRSSPTCSGRPSRSRTTTSCCRSARWRSTRRS